MSEKKSTRAKKDVNIKKSVESEIEKRKKVESLSVDPYAEKKLAEKKRVKKSADDFIESIFVSEEIKQKYNDLKTEISEKETMLKEIYGLEACCTKIADLINTFNVTQIELNTEAEQEKQRREDEFNQLKEQIERKEFEAKRKYNQDISDLKLEYEIYKKKLDDERLREASEYEYNTNRDHIKADDIWKESLANREKTIKAKEEDLEQRINELNQKEEHIKNMEISINEFPDLLKKAREEERELAIKECNSKFAIEKNAISRNGEHTKELLQSKINYLENEASGYKKTIQGLQEELKYSYERLQNLATTVAQNSGISYITPTTVGGTNQTNK